MLRSLSAALVLAVLIASCSNDRAEFEEIRTAATEHVRERLKSPSSAISRGFSDTAWVKEIPRESKTDTTDVESYDMPISGTSFGDANCLAVRTSDSTAYVSGKFESQNGFGAMVAGTYSGFMMKRGDKWTTVLPLEID